MLSCAMRAHLRALRQAQALLRLCASCGFLLFFFFPCASSKLCNDAIFSLFYCGKHYKAT
jgi:hypothetical protein